LQSFDVVRKLCQSALAIDVYHIQSRNLLELALTGDINIFDNDFL
jgi:hypothetical protein